MPRIDINIRVCHTLFMNTKQKGDLGVAAAIFYFTKQGCVVSVPLTNNSRYDLIVESKNKLIKYQVKTTGQIEASGSYCVELSTQGGNRSWDGTIKYIDENEVDAVFIYCLDGTAYDMPVKICSQKRRLRLGLKQKPYKVI